MFSLLYTAERIRRRTVALGRRPGLALTPGSRPLRCSALSNSPQAIATLQERRGDRLANTLLDRAADFLSFAVANYVTATDPGHVLTAFLSARRLRRIGDRFRAGLVHNTLPPVFAATRLEVGLVDPEGRRAGAAALALEQTYLDASAPRARRVVA